MISINIRSAAHPYRAVIGSGLLTAAAELVKETFPATRCAIITDTNVGPLFSGALAKNLRSAAYEPKLITLPAGEESKTLERAGEICEQMLEVGLNRQSFVVGLGGGVVGDLSGFVAAIFERGIPHVQIPTTLLAMVDSSIGGKTGVNARAGKNLIGAFHPPSLVIDDVDVLKTLPPREFSQGFAEIIKHGVIADAAMFRQLEEMDPGTIDFATLIKRNVEIKASVVEQDEREKTGGRALLNFGHTIGHGIERAGNYHSLLHGEAISLGMVAAADISTKKFGLAREQSDRIIELLTKFGLPTRLPKDFPRARIFDALKFDKKFEHGEIRFIVIPKIGAAQLSRELATEDIREAIAKL